MRTITILLVLSLLLLSVAPAYGVEVATEEPCMEKCALNFVVFFLAPLLVAGAVIFYEYRHQRGEH